MQRVKAQKRKNNGGASSELGERLAQIRKEIEADPKIKMLDSIDQVRKEVEDRRTGNDWKR
jgi:hypothetical protein